MAYNAAEKEAIGLCVSLEAVGDMANHALLELRDVSMYPGEVEKRKKVSGTIFREASKKGTDLFYA